MGRGKTGSRGEEEERKRGVFTIMSPLLLLRPSPGCLLTVFGSFSASRNKLASRAAAAAAAPRLFGARNTMHYQTEERGRPNSPDYRIYFSKSITGENRVPRNTKPVLSGNGLVLGVTGGRRSTSRSDKRLTLESQKRSFFFLGMWLFYHFA